MKKYYFLVFAILSFLHKSTAQTTLTFVNNTSQLIYGAYAIYDEDDGWTTHGWYRVNAYSEKSVGLGNYSGSVYVHGHNSWLQWGNDTNMCTGGSDAFHVKNADKVRCEYSRGFSRMKISSGQKKSWTFNP